jgi:GNAT superfamily N-acetyltransferase
LVVLHAQGVKIRVTNEQEDIPKVYDLLEAFAREAGIKPDVLDRDNFFEQWARISGCGAAFLVLLEDGDKVVGALGALVHPAIYWTWTVASETFLYIYPSHRTGLGAVRLLRAFEREAKSRGCRQVYSGHKTYFQTDSMQRLLTGLGYSPREVIYLKDL